MTKVIVLWTVFAFCFAVFIACVSVFVVHPSVASGAFALGSMLMAYIVSCFVDKTEKSVLGCR